MTAYYWTIREFVRERYLRFLFAEGDDERSQIADLVARVESLLDRWCQDDPEAPATVRLDGQPDRVVRGAVRRDRAQARRRRRRLARPPVRGHGRRVPAPARGRPPPGRPPHLGDGGRGSRPPPDRLGGEPGHGHRHPQPPRPGEAVRDRRDDQAAVRAQGADGPARAAPLPRPRRAQPVRPARGLEPDQGGPARRRRARPEPRDHPRRRRADRVRGRAPGHRQLARSGSSAGSTWPRRSAPSTASCRPSPGPGPAILKPGSVIVQQPSIPTPLQVRFPFPCWATRAEEAAPAGGDPFAAFEAD